MKDAMLLTGFGLLVAGCWRYADYLGMIVAGGLLLTGALFAHFRSTSHKG